MFVYQDSALRGFASLFPPTCVARGPLPLTEAAGGQGLAKPSLDKKNIKL